MSSSLRNAVKRKTHKERAQPSGRKHLGLLEKKKDYKLRAQDYASKKKRLEALRLKAELRNKDEFYFGMVHGQTKKGVHVSGGTGAKEHQPSADVLKLIRTQNKGYLENTLAVERSKVERMQQGLHFVGASEGAHTVFVDDAEQARGFDAAEYFETTPALVDDAHNRLTIEQLKTIEAPLARTSVLKASEKAYGKLSHGIARIEALQASVDHLDLKRKLMGKGKRFKVKGECFCVLCFGHAEARAC